MILVAFGEGCYYKLDIRRIPWIASKVCIFIICRRFYIDTGLVVGESHWKGAGPSLPFPCLLCLAIRVYAWIQLQLYIGKSIKRTILFSLLMYTYIINSGLRKSGLLDCFCFFCFQPFFMEYVCLVLVPCPTYIAHYSHNSISGSCQICKVHMGLFKGFSNCQKM